MTIAQKKPLTEEELKAGLVISDSILFRRYFFRDELTEKLSLEQLLFMCDESDQVLLCTARKVFKTGHLEAEVIQDMVTHVSESDGVGESLFFAPSEVHLNPFIDRVFSRLERNGYLGSLVRDKRRGDNSYLEGTSGIRWYLRIEGTSGTGKNAIGLRAQKIIGDECAYGSFGFYNELLQTALPGCKWIMAGVPNGVRSSPFYELDQTDRGKRWSRWKFPTFINPIYQSAAAKQKLIDDYGGENTQGYVTQVLGLWGEEMTSSFPPGSIASHNYPYFIRNPLEIRNESELSRLSLLLGIPTVRCNKFAASLDYGYSPDPSVFFGAFCKEDKREWKTYCRIVMNRVPMAIQAAVINHILKSIFSGTFVGFSTDKLELTQALQKLNPTYHHLFLWSNPGGSTPVEVTPEEFKTMDTYRRKVKTLPEGKKIVNKPNKELYTDWLKSWMINAVVDLEGMKLWLGEDGEVVSELVATSERKSEGRTIYFAQTDPNNRKMVLDHNRESLTYLAHAIDTGLKSEGKTQSEEELLAAMGWVGGGGNSDRESEVRKMPWET